MPEGWAIHTRQYMMIRSIYAQAHAMLQCGRSFARLRPVGCFFFFCLVLPTCHLAWSAAGLNSITVENIVGPQYGTGITTIEAFHTDGAFVALAPADSLGGPTDRRMEFIGSAD